jgi:hypothetical protein
MAFSNGKTLRGFHPISDMLEKNLEGKDFTSELEKLNETLNSIKDKRERIPPLSLIIERMDKTRGGVVNIYLTLKDSENFAQKL